MSVKDSALKLMFDHFSEKEGWVIKDYGGTFDVELAEDKFIIGIVYTVYEFFSVDFMDITNKTVENFAIELSEKTMDKSVNDLEIKINEFVAKFR